MSKYHNIKTEIDGHKFDSLKEGRHYVFLKTREKLGEIEGLELQPRFDLVINKMKCGFYRADFLYLDKRTGEQIVEDVKSKPTMTTVYRLKKKLVKALYNIDIVEV